MDLKYPTIRRWTLKTLLPITKWIGAISFGVSHRIDDGIAFEIEHHLRIGDVILVYARGHATNLVIPGQWKHAAMYVGEIAGRMVVIEALGKGVQFTDFAQFAVSKDRIMVVRPMFCDAAMSEQAVVYAKTLIDKPYDYLVEYSIDSRINETFYCSEIPWWSYDRAMIAANLKSPFVPRETMGVPTITPQDYANAKDKWAIIGKWPNLG